MAKKQRESKINEFNLSFFKEPHTTFAVVEVNGFVLTRNIVPPNNAPVVYIFTKESFKRSYAAKNHTPSKQQIKAKNIKGVLEPVTKEINIDDLYSRVERIEHFLNTLEENERK